MMEKPDLIMMGPMLQSVGEELEKDFTVHRLWEADDTAAKLKELAPTTRYIATNTDKGCSAEVIAALPNLALVSSFGVGYDKVDVKAARAAGVSVTNTPDVLNDCVAETTIALMLALCRKLPEAEAYVREGRWEREGAFPLTEELTGKRVGILGLGRIGKEIARRLQVFKMEVVYHGRNRQPYEPYPYYADLKTMAADVDWLVVIAPGTPETRNIIDEEILEALGEKSYLVNVARGSLVDEDALIEALQNNRIAGAALDVFAQEPRVPEALTRLRNTVLMPHIGSATHKTRRMMGDLVVKNLRAHLRGEVLISPVA